MTNKDPAAVDAYITQQLLSRDGDQFTKILEANAQAGLPAIQTVGLKSHDGFLLALMK